MFRIRIKTTLLVVVLLAVLVIVGTAVGVYAFPKTKATERYFENAAVVTNGKECAKIGVDILKNNGSAADAAIAALFCEGIACSQSMGLGGGFLMTIYIKENKTVETLNARETAPRLASKDMYAGNQSLAQRGGLAVAVPGELKGYWEVHKKYGKLAWKTLIQPTIDLCRKGTIVTSYLAKLLRQREKKILESPSMREIYINPKTQRTWEEGDKIKREKLAETLEIIANEGADALYNGSLTEQFVEDIKNFGGIITVQDMNDYKVKWSDDPIQVDLLKKFKLFTVPLPGSGPVLAFILNVLNDYLNFYELDGNSIAWQRICESFKFAYGKKTEFGDPDFEPGLDELVKQFISPEYANEVRSEIRDNITYQDPRHYGVNYSEPVEDHGTAHISIIAPNGDAVSVTSTINLVLGAMIRSTSTGILLNDEMDDFSSPNMTNAYDMVPSPANFIKPGKRPLSSMNPTIIIDNDGNVRLVIGGAGGTKITTAVALGIIKNIFFNETMRSSVNSKRLHHQLFPMAVRYEEGFEKDVIEKLGSFGHVMEEIDLSDGFAAVTAIAVQDNKLYPVSDKRRYGSEDGF